MNNFSLFCLASRPTILSMRASSAIDTEAQRRAKARANYGALVQQKINKIALSKLFMI